MMNYEVKGKHPPFELWRKDYFFGYFKTRRDALNVIECLGGKVRYCRYTEYGRYRITRTIKGKTISYGTYTSLEVAVKIIGRLNDVEWDKNQLEYIRKEVLENE